MSARGAAQKREAVKIRLERPGAADLETERKMHKTQNCGIAKIQKCEKGMVYFSRKYFCNRCCRAPAPRGNFRDFCCIFVERSAKFVRAKSIVCRCCYRLCVVKDILCDIKYRDFLILACRVLAPSSGSILRSAFLFAFAFFGASLSVNQPAVPQAS